MEYLSRLVKPVVITALLMCSAGAYSQFLSAEEAVSIALQNNYSIRLSRLDEKILENNLNKGYAGFLPVVDATATQNNSITNSRQEYLSGQVNERDNAKASSLNAGVGLDWTIFNGFRMFAGYDILKRQLEAGRIETRLEVENAVSNVLNLYYQLVELRQKVRMLEASVQLGRARAEIADDKLSIGAGSRLELLQARVDMNADISELLNLNDQITETTINLNLLLGRNADVAFSVEDTIVLVSPPDLAALRSSMQQNNAGLRLNRKNLEIASLNLREIRGRYYPELGVNAGYNFNKQESESGFIKSGRSDGFNYGLTAKLPILNGLNNNRDQQNAKIRIESANLAYETFLAELDATLLSTHSIYMNKLKNIEMERQNLETAHTNFDIANERYRLGELSGIEIREAQQNLFEAQDRVITLVYQARILEVEMLRLSGNIIPAE